MLTSMAAQREADEVVCAASGASVNSGLDAGFSEAYCSLIIECGEELLG